MADYKAKFGSDPDQFAAQAFDAMHIVAEALKKVSLSGSVGTEWRQHQGGLKDDPSLIFSLGGSWSPREGTSISLEAHRRNQTSITLANSAQSYLLTGFYGTVRQRFYRKYAVSLTGGYDNADYQANVAGVSANRHDEFFSVSPAVDCEFNDRWTASFFYLYRENASTGTGANGFSNNQVGLRTSYRF